MRRWLPVARLLNSTIRFIILILLFGLVQRVVSQFITHEAVTL